MRMRTNISNPNLLAKVAQSIEKLGKTCLLKFTPAKLHFIIITDPDSGVQVWSQLDAASIFENYRIQSASNNEIYLDFYIEYLIRALKSTQGALEIMMKLTKKENIPMLSLAITSQTRMGRKQSLTQDIPVRVLSPQQMEMVREPMCPDPQVHIMMPPLLSVRTIAERMKSLSDYVVISANMNGEFTLKCEANMVTMETYYKGLFNPELEYSESEAARVPSQTRDKNQFASARIDVKNFVKFLNTYHVSPSNVVCCIIEHHAIVFYVYVNHQHLATPGQTSQRDRVETGVLTFYIPVVEY
ncbi:uncharacterized protein VTP21DRAFT_5099 [Calcarisporiella thermophila]|uniref:uncharacterized protein n=1 Tax=Calcarisporiella thermophila TaxID=911321 RepID=UPI0037444673